MKVVLNTRISNLEKFLYEVRFWDLDFRLMGAGGLVGHLKQLASKDVLITYARFNKRLDQSGATPPGYRTFAIPGYGCHGFWWRGYKVTRDDLLVFPASNELQSVSFEDFEVFTISVKISYLERLVDNLCLKEIPDSADVVIRLNSTAAEILRYQAGTIVRAENGSLDPVATQELTERLIICAAQGRQAKISPFRRRDLAVDRIVEYARNNSAPTSDLEKLCRLARVSERTLQYAFRERYGIPPNVFVKRWNLNSARRLLQESNPAESTVTEIASKLGFLHQGQFSTDYRRLFDELPSTTLRS